MRQYLDEQGKKKYPDDNSAINGFIEAKRKQYLKE
jgi:hypothetical protein